jgi:hypothetical protein
MIGDECFLQKVKTKWLKIEGALRMDLFERKSQRRPTLTPKKAASVTLSI